MNPCLDLQERPSGQVVRGIEEGAAEIGIASGEAETRSLEAFHYRYDNLVPVVRPDHPLAVHDRLQIADTLDFDHGAGMGLRSIRLCDEWARRELKVVVRDSRQLSSTSRLVLDHLREAERKEGERSLCATLRR
jgi:DNA-binding transcriptional LysR family regulator